MLVTNLTQWNANNAEPGKRILGILECGPYTGIQSNFLFFVDGNTLTSDYMMLIRGVSVYI